MINYSLLSAASSLFFIALAIQFIEHKTLSERVKQELTEKTMNFTPLFIVVSYSILTLSSYV